MAAVRFSHNRHFTKMDIREDETLDDLQLKGLKLIQKKSGFRLCLETVLLADFAKIHPGDRVCDLGTGTGALMLLLWGRNKGRAFWGIEIQQEMAEMAQRTMILNRLEDHMKVICCPAADAAHHISRQGMDAVVCNPPWPRREKERNVHQPVARDLARHQNAAEMLSFLSAAKEILREKGKLFIVYPASDMLDLMVAMRSVRIEPKCLRFVYPFSDRPANIVLLEGVSGGKPMLQLMPPLILYQKNGLLTNELKSIYHMDEQTEVYSGG